MAGNWTNTGTFNSGQGAVILDGLVQQNISAGGIGIGKAFYNMVVNNPGLVLLSSSADIDHELLINAGTLFLNGQILQFGSAGGSTISISGTLDMNDASVLQMADATQLVVNSGGTLRVAGSDPLNRPVVTHLNSGNYEIFINNGATLDTRLAIFEYSGGDAYCF